MIHAGSYTAKVRTLGGGLSELKFGNRNLIDPYVEDEVMPKFRGDLLIPWPNRIRDGRYSFDQRDFQLPTNEVERSNALHGCVFGLNWEVVELSSTSISLSATLHEGPNYPSALQCSVTYRLSHQGLCWTVDVTNIGNSRVPYGVSVHPYLIADPVEKIDSCALTIPAAMYMEVDPGRLLPIGLRTVEEGDLDFRKRALVGNRRIDHAFLLDDRLTQPRIEVRASSGLGVWMDSDRKGKWVQIHTADRGREAGSRSCLVVEPMTCPPDAFNSGIDLIYLEPGVSHCMSWRIGAL